MAYNSISDLRKARGGFESLMKEVDKLDNPKKETRDDNRFWKPTVDKAGNGFSVIRFLPPSQGEDLPWVQIWNHGFQGPTGKWYIENSLTTIGKPDPVSELNSKLWNSGVEADKEVARKQKRKLQYYANILVIKDPANPENEGQVFLFKFGKKIFEKIKDVMKPQFEDEEPVNPFDFWQGANFKLKVRKFEGYPNYDKSEFDSSAPIAEDDDEIEAIWKKQHSLKEFLDPSNFKSYEELKKRLELVLNGGGGVSAAAMDEVERPTPAPAMKETKPKAIRQAVEEDDEESLSYFAKLASEE